MQLFFEQLLNGVAMGAIYSLITLGLALVYGVMRILHVAHAAVYTAGAYVGLYVFSITGSLLPAVPAAMAACALLGTAIERLVYTPLLKYPPFVPLIGSIAVFLGLEEIFRLVGGPYILSFPAEFPFPGITVRGVVISPAIISIYAVSAAVLLLLWFIVTKTELGLAMRATSQDREIAGDAAEGFYIVTNFDRDDPRPVVQGFLAEFRNRHKFEPDMVGASAYDAFMIIMDGMKTAGSTDGKKVRDAIAAVKDYNGLTGIIGGFDEIGEVVKPVQVQVVKDGLFRHFGVVTEPELIKP